MTIKHIRITPHTPTAEELKKLNAPVLTAYLDESIEYLEYQLRYAKTEETSRLQGALRALDDIRDLLL